MTLGDTGIDLVTAEVIGSGTKALCLAITSSPRESRVYDQV
jgi:hypothetical protein